MRESLTDFELVEYNPVSHRSRKETRLYTSNIFDRRELRFIAVSSGREGIKVYLNGVVAAEGRLQIERAAFNGYLIVGDAPSHTDAWRGEIRGIAIYNRELSQTRIVQHYQTWKDRARPTVSSGG